MWRDVFILFSATLLLLRPAAHLALAPPHLPAAGERSSPDPRAREVVKRHVAAHGERELALVDLVVVPCNALPAKLELPQD